jgi:hypothetical protein
MEEGPCPALSGLYGAEELEAADYPTRTRRYAEAAEMTFWFGSTDTPGARTTLRA